MHSALALGNETPSFLGYGEIASLIRSMDWRDNPLGPPHRWCPVLSTWVGTALASSTPMAVLWGESGIQIYNDAYGGIAGLEHARAFAAPFERTWSPELASLGAAFRAALSGEPRSVAEQRVSVARAGNPRDAFLSFGFSPIRDQRGRIPAVLLLVGDSTANVLRKRRHRVLRDVSDALRGCRTLAHVRSGFLNTLAAREDVPSAILYLFDSESHCVSPIAAIGADAAVVWKGCIRSGEGTASAAEFAQAADRGRSVELTELDRYFWTVSLGRERPRHGLVVPLGSGSGGAPLGFLVAGVNPRFALDEGTREFYELLGGALGTALALARASETEACSLADEVDHTRMIRPLDEPREQQTLPSSFAMQAPIPICVTVGREHHYQLVNSAWQALFPDRELQGRRMQDAHPELIGTGVLEKRNEVFETGTRYAGVEIPMPLTDPDGNVQGRYLNSIYEPLTGPDGQVEGVATFAVDVTELVQARQQLEQSDQRMDEFLAMLAHELRNPLAPIRTALHIMKCREPGSMGRHLQIIDRQTENLTRLVDGLLDVSRITRGKIELRREQLEFGKIITRALDSVGDLFERKKLQFSLSISEIACPLTGDPVRLEQVVVNLLTNAAKYTNPGGSVHVSLERSETHAELRVRDTGLGISPEMLPRIFNLFEQAQQSLDRAQGGLGIGLTLVRSLVQYHGGEVAAQSAGIGSGSEFVVRLPLSVARDVTDDPSAPVASRGRWMPSEARLRVLVVDDNVDAAETLQDLLVGAGHEVRVCHDGPAALGLTSEFRPDVVLLDIGLPEMDGYEVARKLRSTLSAPPVLIALTGYGQESDRKKAFEVGFDEHLVKPVPLETLIGALERCGLSSTPKLESQGPFGDA